MEDKKPTKHSEVVMFLFHILHISLEHSKVYELELKEKGFDSVSNLIHFLVLDDVEDMTTTEDFSKIKEYFNNIKGHKKMNIVRIVMNEITSALNKPWESLRRPSNLEELVQCVINDAEREVEVPQGSFHCDTFIN